MNPLPIRVLGVAVGVGAGVLGGWAAGGWWWAAATVTVASVIGSWRDRALGHAHALGTLALVGGAVAADRPAVIPLLVGGFVASVELQAAADRVTAVRPWVPSIAPVAATALGAVTLAAVVLALGVLSEATPALGSAVAAAAAVAALRVIAR